MERNSITSCICFLLVLTLGASVQAQDSNILPPQGDFRVNVTTDRDFYHNKDILRLTVELLNDSPNAVQIARYQVEPAPVIDPTTAETLEAVVDGVAVDAVIRPYWPTVIGYARLVPLDFNSRLMMGGTDALAMPEIAYVLPLFGSPAIAPHSTRIISTVNIWIGCPVIEPMEPIDPVQPILLETDGAAVEIERPTIDVAGKFYAVWPGRYLLEVSIDRIWGVKFAQAQKIVRIGPRPPVKPDPVLRLLTDNNATIHRVDRRTEEMAQVLQKDLAYAVYNNQYIRAIYRLLTGKPLPTPIPVTDATTTETLTRTTDKTLRTR